MKGKKFKSNILKTICLTDHDEIFTEVNGAFVSGPIAPKQNPIWRTVAILNFEKMSITPDWI